MILKLDEEKFILLLMYLQMVLLNFFGVMQIMNKVIILLIFIVIINNAEKVKTDLIGTIAFCFLFLMNMVFKTDGSIVIGIRNFLVLLYPFSQAYYIYYLCRHENQKIEECLRDGFWLFNITAVLHLLAALVQCFVPGVITAVNTYGYEVMDFDNVYGFFAYGATHTLCVFMVFIIIYDIAQFGKMENGPIKIIFGVYTCMIIFMMALISSIGDNKAFYILLPMALLLFFIFHNLKRINVQKVFKIVGGILGAIVLFVLLYLVNSKVQMLADKYLLSTFDIAKSAIYLGNEAYGSTERIAILLYSLGMGSTYFLGTGFRSAMVFESGYMGFAHFGQADFGALLILGGIWITAFIMVVYCRMLMKMSMGQVKQNVICWISVFVFLLIVAIYTQCFTRTDVVLCICLLVLSLRHAGSNN